MDRPADLVRVARIITRLSVSGPTRHVCALTAKLDPERFRSWLICGRLERGERTGFEIAAQAGIQPIYVDQLRRGLGLWDLGALLRIRKLLTAIKPKIVATHHAKAGTLGRTLALFRLLSGKDRPRLVHTFHGHVFHDYFNSAATRAFIAIERQLASLTDLIIAISPTVKRDLTEVYKIAPPEKVRVVPLGLDFGWVNEVTRYRGWLRDRLGASNSTVVFGLVGRLTKVKNPALAMLGFARFVRTENRDARLVFLGDGELRDSLETLAGQLGIADRVLFCGWELDRARIFSDLDVTCLSSANEGTPVCLIESLAAGVPVVSTRVGGVADVVIDGADGHLVEPDNPEAFAAALARSARRRVCVPSDRSGAVRSQYSVPRLVAAIQNIYEEILDPCWTA